MERDDRVELFDEWSKRYDQSVAAGERFPFIGYEAVLDRIVEWARVTDGDTVLDLGIGTGNLAARFASTGCPLWGLDFSYEMLKRATQKVPRAQLVRAGLTDRWPRPLQRRFDRVVSAYTFHELDDNTRTELLARIVSEHLEPGGRMVIGDIGFPTAEIREHAHKQWARLWDEEEHYWAADEAVQRLEAAGLAAEFEMVSSCAGVFVVTAGG